MYQFELYSALITRWLRALNCHDSAVLGMLMRPDVCLSVNNGLTPKFYSSPHRVVQELMSEIGQWRQGAVQVDQYTVKGNQITLNLQVKITKSQQISKEKRTILLSINGRRIESIMLQIPYTTQKNYIIPSKRGTETYLAQTV